MAQDAAPLPTIALVGPDAGFLNQIAAALAPVRSVGATVVPEAVELAAKRPEVETAAVVVVDLDPRRRDSLIALQGLTARLGAGVPVIVLVDAFDDALARWLMQIRVADFLRKPVEPRDVLKACVRALQGTQSAGAEVPGGAGRILTFVSAAGGVGTTTLAIESAMILHREDGKEAGKDGATCLVDLDFQTGPCADYLDLEPRLDLDEVTAKPERLDLQLLEVMIARHASGLHVLAARGRPAGRPQLDADVVLRLLDLVSARFSNVVIDLPRAWESWTDQVLLASNRVFVITDMTVPGLRLGRRMTAALSERLPDLAPKVVVNRFEQQMLFGTGLRRADVERALDGLLAGTVSNNYRLVREAIDRGVPLDAVKAGSNVTADLRKIVLGGGAVE
jgi:pilus assembly protein CpaE